jgi:flavin reductase (DIM6/NTAB) family NADH-FMN oxidoreductase RutF
MTPGESSEQRPEWLIPSGVFVVTLRSGDRVNAYAAAWVVRVSEVPVMLQVAVWEKNYSHELAHDCDHFVVQILAEGQQSIARHFGRNSGRDMNKFLGFSTHPGLSGIPILEDCLAYLECKTSFRNEFGDHMVLIGKVINSRINTVGEQVLIYKHSDYPFLNINVD